MRVSQGISCVTILWVCCLFFCMCILIEYLFQIYYGLCGNGYILCCKFPYKNLYEKLKGRWEYIDKVEKMIRTDSLVRVMPNLFEEKQDTFLEQHMDLFRNIEHFFILINKEEVV